VDTRPKDQARSLLRESRDNGVRSRLGGRAPDHVREHQGTASPPIAGPDERRSVFRRHLAGLGAKIGIATTSGNVVDEEPRDRADRFSQAAFL